MVRWLSVSSCATRGAHKAVSSASCAVCRTVACTHARSLAHLRRRIHHFEDVTSVIFVASLSEYDQQLAEDPTMNRLCESLDLFSEISNSKWFARSALILFLNKRDLFEKKIASVELRHARSGPDDPVPSRFLDYTGGPSPEAALRYITDRFLEQPRHRAHPVRRRRAPWERVCSHAAARRGWRPLPPQSADHCSPLMPCRRNGCRPSCT